MPRYCAAYGCTNSSFNLFQDGKRISFHRFPIKNSNLLKTWLCKIKREDFIPTEYSSLCSIHFEEDCFDIQKFTNRRYLKKDAVPTIFMHKSGVKRKRIPCPINQDNPITDYCILCTARRKDYPSRKYHRFPRNAVLSNKWASVTKKKWVIAASAVTRYKRYRICSEHFSSEQYTGFNKSRLHPAAVPAPLKYVSSKSSAMLDVSSLKSSLNTKLCSTAVPAPLADVSTPEYHPLKPSLNLPVCSTDDDDLKAKKPQSDEEDDYKYSALLKTSEEEEVVVSTSNKRKIDKTGTKESPRERLNNPPVNSKSSHAKNYGFEAAKETHEFYPEVIIKIKKSNNEETISEETMSNREETSESDQESETEENGAVSSTTERPILEKFTPCKISKRVEAFGRLVACEMNSLLKHPSLYLKAQQSILKTLLEAQTELMSFEL